MYPLKKVTWRWCGFDNSIVFRRWRPTERHCNHAVCLRGAWEPHPDKRHPPGVQSPAFRLPSRSPAEAIWSSLKVQDVSRLQNWAVHARADPWQTMCPSIRQLHECLCSESIDEMRRVWDRAGPLRVELLQVLSVFPPPSETCTLSYFFNQRTGSELESWSRFPGPAGWHRRNVRNTFPLSGSIKDRLT